MFQIDLLSRTPIYEQIVEQMERFILTGVISPGEQVLSVRSVAVEHSVNPRTILKAYADLDARGVIRPVPGKGYFVCENAKQILSAGRLTMLGELSELLDKIVGAGIDKKTVLKYVDTAYAADLKD